MKEKLSVIAALVILLGTAFSVYFYFENRYALAQALQKTDQKVDKSIKTMDYNFKSLQSESLQSRIWKIEDRYGKDPKDPVIKETLRKLYLDKEKVDKQIKVYEMEK